MIVFVHTKFGLVRIQGNQVKRGGGGIRPLSERVFEIPVRVGLSRQITPHQKHYMTLLFRESEIR